MKKRLVDVDFFYPSELVMYKKHLKHGKNPGEKAVEKAEKKSKRMVDKLEIKKTLENILSATR